MKTLNLVADGDSPGEFHVLIQMDSTFESQLKQLATAIEPFIGQSGILPKFSVPGPKPVALWDSEGNLLTNPLSNFGWVVRAGFTGDGQKFLITWGANIEGVGKIETECFSFENLAETPDDNDAEHIEITVTTTETSAIPARLNLENGLVTLNVSDVKLDQELSVDLRIGPDARVIGLESGHYCIAPLDLEDLKYLLLNNRAQMA